MQNFIKIIISAIKSWTKKEIKNSTADWNQNDTSADNYIKNRTHWEDTHKTILIPETTVTVFEDDGCADLDSLDSQLVEGQTYFVILNGVEYTCVARYYAGWDCILIGNGTVCGADDEGNDEPFCIDSYVEGDIYLNANSGEYTCSIATMTIHKLDPKYLDLPDNVATTDDVQGAVDFTMSEVNNAQTIADNALTTANAAQSTADENANKLLTYKQGTCILPSNRSWIGLAYGDGKFVASAINAQYAAYSEDGISWVETAMSTKASWREVTYGNGKFVIVSYGSNTVAYSEDGINWAKTTMPVTDNWNSIAYGNGRFVAIANSSANGAYSINGATWYQTTLPSNSTWLQVIYGNSKFVAIAGNDKDGMGGKDIAYSNDGVNWTPVSNPITSETPQGIAYGNGRFVIFATNYPSLSPVSIAYSEDGINWNSINVQFSSNNINYITYGNGKFVMVGGNGFAAYSEDGISWVETAMPTKAFWQNVIYDDDKFIAIANSSTDAAYSEDGINWSSEYIAIIQNEENKTKDIRNLILEGNTPISSPDTATIGQTIVVKNVDENGKPTEWKSADRNKFDFMFLIDDTTSYEYIIRMQNGNLTSICKASSLAVSTLPTKTAYTVGETLDLTDMVVTLTRQDGATEEVDNYSYTEPDMSAAGTVDVTVSYVEAGETYSATFAVTINEATTTEETETTT